MRSKLGDRPCLLRRHRETLLLNRRASVSLDAQVREHETEKAARVVLECDYGSKAG